MWYIMARIFASRELIEELTDLPVAIELASDFMDRRTPVFRDDTCFFVSQSGETHDTLQALKYCKERGALCVGITNTPASAIAKLTDCGVYLNAGPEISVASTKAYTSQIVAITLIALQLGQDKISTKERREAIIGALQQLSVQVQRVLELEDSVRKLAAHLSCSENILFIGRGFNYPTCLEAALKLKEISYIHAQGIPMGELKHGSLALVTPLTPMLLVATRDSLRDQVLSGLQQILARQGDPIVIGTSGDSEIENMVTKFIPVPQTVDCLQVILNIIPLQLLALHIATLKGYNVDKPRNLAKSVTVG